MGRRDLSSFTLSAAVGRIAERETALLRIRCSGNFDKVAPHLE